MNNMNYTHIDVRKLEEISQGSDERLLKYIDIFLEESPDDLRNMQSQVQEKHFVQLLSTDRKSVV